MQHLVGWEPSPINYTDVTFIFEKLAEDFLPVALKIFALPEIFYGYHFPE